MGEPPSLLKLIPTVDGAEPYYCTYKCGDPDCREWWIEEVLDDQAQRTGQRIYHVTECNMSDPTSKKDMSLNCILCKNLSL